MHALLRSVVIAAAFVACAIACSAAPEPNWQAAVDQAAHSASDARILVLDLTSGRLLASHHLSDAARTLSAPGSTLKPLVLYQLIAASRWNADRRIACDRKLVVAGHRLACTHPSALPFNAREALAWSCNTYFANVARSLQPGDLGRLLRPTGLLSITGLTNATAPTESAAEFHEPTNIESTQLALLGVDGIRVTPLELAAAYRWLALQLTTHPNGAAPQIVLAGITDSVSYGMARQAAGRGVSIAGKTGTAESATTSQTHGWFAGIAPANKPAVVFVIYLPAGRGADAAAIAATLLAHSPLAHTSQRSR